MCNKTASSRNPSQPNKTPHVHPAMMSSPQASSGGWQSDEQLYVLFFVMFSTLRNMVVSLSRSCVDVMRLSMYMDLWVLHLGRKVQYTTKPEPRCTTALALDHSTQDVPSPASREARYFLRTLENGRTSTFWTHQKNPGEIFTFYCTSGASQEIRMSFCLTVLGVSFA